jgi:hypothetical protein
MEFPNMGRAQTGWLPLSRTEQATFIIQGRLYSTESSCQNDFLIRQLRI